MAIASQSPKESVGTDPGERAVGDARRRLEHVGPGDPGPHDLDLRQRERLVALDEHQVAVGEVPPEHLLQRLLVPNRRTVVRRGVTKAPAAAPAPAWRCESLPGTSSSASLVVCLTRPDGEALRLQPGQQLDDDRRLARVVAADERDGGGLAVRVEEEGRPAREEGLSRVVVPRDLGPQVAVALDDLPEALGPRQQIDRRPVVELVALGAPAKVHRRQPSRRFDHPQSRLKRPERGPVGQVDLRAAAGLARVLVEHRPEPVREELHARQRQRVQGLRPARSDRAMARRRPRTGASSRGPRRGWCPRAGTSPGRRARCPSSACWARAAPTGAPSRPRASRAPSPRPGTRRGRGRGAARRRKAGRARRPSCRGAPGSDGGRRTSGSPSTAGRPRRRRRSDWAGRRRRSAGASPRRPPSRAASSRCRCSTGSRRRPRRRRLLRGPRSPRAGASGPRRSPRRAKPPAVPRVRGSRTRRPPCRSRRPPGRARARRGARGARSTPRAAPSRSARRPRSSPSRW